MSTLPLRSWLFVPGDSERKQAKAVSAGADALILDLEDSVAASQLPAARTCVREFLNAHRQSASQLWVRTHAPSSTDFEADLTAVVPGKPAGLVLPKVSSPREIAEVSAKLTQLESQAGFAPGSIRLMAIATETPAALLRLGEFAHGADARLVALTWGMEDLGAAMGVTTQREPDGSLVPVFELARTLCLVAAAAAGVQAVDSVYTAFRDLEGLSREAARARRDGFGGKLAIHPDQVRTIHEAFTPSTAEVEHARRVVAAFEAAGESGVTSLDGKMLDRPHLIQAQRVLSLSARASRP